MALSSEDVEMLDKHARQVGEVIGRDLRFVETPTREHCGITVDNVFVYGPKKQDELTVHDVGMELDMIATGGRRIVADSDGDPQLM